MVNMPLSAIILALVATPGQTAPAYQTPPEQTAPAHQTPPGHTAPVPANRVLARLEQALFPTLGPASARVAAARNARYDACATSAPCRIEAALWSAQDLAGASPALTREASGLNGILHVYGQGQAPQYPAIDGPDPKATAITQDIVTAALERVEQLARETPEADRGLLLALALLDGADKLDAIRFGPLARGENAAAFARARHLDWKHYRYTAIIVPGIGPEDGAPLSAGGKVNVDLAAARYRAGLAPFILLSGGSVHPRGTAHVEAIEMRKALIERYGIPAQALIVDPYARHTTTNLRNASRLLIAMGAPMKQPALIVTHDYQSTYIVTEAFARRNQSDLGYMPMVLGKVTTRNEVPAFPDARSLAVDPRDPLDP